MLLYKASHLCFLEALSQMKTWNIAITYSGKVWQAKSSENLATLFKHLAETG